MTRSTVAILVLGVALAATNLLWFSHEVNFSLATAQRESQCRLEGGALSQTLAILPVAARPDSTPAEVIAAAMKAASRKDSFQKDGRTYVGELALQFGDTGRLSAVETTWLLF